MNLIKNKKIQIIAGILTLGAIVYPIFASACPIIPGSGGFGASAPGQGPTLAARDSMQCGCFCGHPECCIPPHEHCIYCGAWAWLFDEATRICGCAGPGGGGQGATQPEITERLNDQTVQNYIDQTRGDYAYEYGGDPASGATDCSGYVGNMREGLGGTSLPRTTAEMMNLPNFDPNFSLSNLAAGDLVFHYGGSHVGMYVGNGLIAHLSAGAGIVRIVPLQSFLNWGGGSAGVLPFY